MNKVFLQFLTFTFLTLILISNYSQIALATNYKYNKIPIKSPVITAGMKPGIAKYNQGNYVGAMQDFENYIYKIPIKQENAIIFAHSFYYIALCYTQLGYKSEAESLYKLISESNINYALSYYSNIALNCIDNENENEICSSPKRYTAPTAQEIAKTNSDLNKDKDDITKFIESGKKIHPSAQDRITKERMERKLQADQYSMQQQQKQVN